MPTRMKTPTDPPQLTHVNRLIIASNRGPVEYQLTHDNTLKARRGAGGMVTALIDAGNRMDVTWVAMTMTEGDRRAVKEAQAHGGLLESPIRGQNMQLRYVAIPKTAYRKHYEKMSNEVLWFLQHYMYDPNQGSTRALQDAWENGYCVANRAIADAINAEIERETTPPVVMLQDYHLYLAAAMIRQRHPAIVMQQFVHIPWPDIRCWHFLPSNIAQAIYSGLAGNDIIGFQTERDARNFLEGARTMLEGAVVDFEEGAVWWQGHRTQARSYPISISVTEERRVVNSTAGKRAAEKIMPLLNEHTVMRVDRIEPTKNIVRGFEAYDYMLERHPELHGKVNFLAFLVPSRQTVPIYRRTTAEVMAAIEDTNKKYGTEDWTPIHAFCDNDRTRALAAMQYYDALLVNPIIDGMNLVAKEGPVVNQRNGVLVLSRTAGAFQQLGKGSIPTSPIDVIETSQALYKALTLSPEEREIKANLARQAVERSDLNVWLSRQIRDINELLERTLPLPGTTPVAIAEDSTSEIVANVS
ncbi:trehalose-6-phosphate synthase [Ktedonosporobacter rubrisoli]|uniref:Trehalose-6-phosphate synthase n=1 Tax=Ktedonosporobacter rubrisoli TaxID=2509675 RepID=A0A4P6JX11_KTERU|nr:trehalose-6-phosphate synthase [Ktedonosporobacter rubrisoli]QBD80154.1 trehalose-6-phosphate synthase [Ktedonosporobacter rubrisoli]